MISYLKGAILSKSPRSIIVLVNNLGYQVFVTLATLEKFKPNQEVELYTHLRHSDDAMSLYGFLTRDELQFFELLISISGVGPKHALGVLNVAKLSDIKKAILRDDASILYKVSGVGKKTAERIVVELKNKLDQMPDVSAQDLASLSDSDTDAFDALVSLGYPDRDVRQALRQLQPGVEKMEDKIREGLKVLGKK